MKDKLIKLIDVKSIITIIMTGTFALLTVKECVNVTDFVDIFKMIVVFYFGTQYGKHNNTGSDT